MKANVNAIPSYEVRAICIKMNNALGGAIDALAAMRGAYSELNALWVKSQFPTTTRKKAKPAAKRKARSTK